MLLNFPLSLVSPRRGDQLILPLSWWSLLLLRSTISSSTLFLLPCSSFTSVSVTILHRQFPLIISIIDAAGRPGGGAEEGKFDVEETVKHLRFTEKTVK